MIFPWEIAPSGCYPSYDYVTHLERLHACLAFAIKVGHTSRASELADQILDIICPTP